jgi:hypothetical protein
MQLNGKEAISGHTRISARTLLLSSVIIILVSFDDINIRDLTVLGVEITERAYSRLAMAFLIFAILNHLVHWLGDYFSYRKWNIDGFRPLTDQSAWGHRLLPYVGQQLHFFEQHLDAADRAYCEIKQIVQRGENLHAAALETWMGNAEAFASKYETASAELGGFVSEAKGFVRFSALYVYGWYLFFPVIVCFGAFYQLYHG